MPSKLNIEFNQLRILNGIFQNYIHIIKKNTISQLIYNRCIQHLYNIIFTPLRRRQLLYSDK